MSGVARHPRDVSEQQDGATDAPKNTWAAPEFPDITLH